MESSEGARGAEQRHRNEQRFHYFSGRGRNRRKSRCSVRRSHATRRVGLDIGNARRDSEKDFRLAHRLLGRSRNKRLELRHDASGNESRDRHHRRWKPFSVEMIYNTLGEQGALPRTKPKSTSSSAPPATSNAGPALLAQQSSRSQSPIRKMNAKRPAHEWSRGDASDPPTRTMRLGRRRWAS